MQLDPPKFWLGLSLLSPRSLRSGTELNCSQSRHEKLASEVATLFVRLPWLTCSCTWKDTLLLCHSWEWIKEISDLVCRWPLTRLFHALERATLREETGYEILSQLQEGTILQIKKKDIVELKVLSFLKSNGHPRSSVSLDKSRSGCTFRLKKFSSS